MWGVTTGRTEDAARIERLLRELGAEVQVRRIELTEEDRDQLGV